MSSQETSSQSSVGSTCDTHNRSVCPKCAFNCVEVEFNNLDTTPLEVKAGYKIFMVYPSQTLFTWSEKNPNIAKLESLAVLDGNSTFDSYTVAENAGWYPHFIPQFDEQVQGVALWDGLREHRFMDFETPAPVPPDYFNTVWCDVCQLTWLKGRTDNHTHPRHQTLPTDAAAERYLDVRSLIVYVDGQLSKDQDKHPLQASIGVYFGKKSKYNISESFLIDTPSKPRADLLATQRAMEVVQADVIPEWLNHLKAANEEEGINHIRLIIATNSQSLVECFTDRIDVWQWDSEKRKYCKPSSGHGGREFVHNSDVIRAIHRLVEEFKQMETGVETLWYHVGKKYTAEAKGLATASVGK